MVLFLNALWAGGGLCSGAHNFDQEAGVAQVSQSGLFVAWGEDDG